MPSIFRSSFAAIATLAAVMLLPAVGVARSPVASSPPRPIRIEGYWERDARAPTVLEGIRVTSSAGGSPRVFGVTALQAYKPAEEGVQVLRNAAPEISLRLLGDESLVRRFMDAPGTQKVVAHGVFRAGSSTLILDSVKVGEAD
jgi:hypothetical protein